MKSADEFGDLNGSKEVEQPEDSQEKTAKNNKLVAVRELRSEDDENSCLRPLGLCDLGGCCDTCWYRPDHPRFKEK